MPPKSTKASRSSGGASAAPSAAAKADKPSPPPPKKTNQSPPGNQGTAPARPTVITSLPSTLTPVAPGHKDGWRRTSTRYFALICLVMLVTAGLVHKYILVQDESSLPIEALVQELEEHHCPPAVQAHFAADPPRLHRSGRLMGEDEGGRLPLPSAYGVGVWADNVDVLLPVARSTIAEIDKRVSVAPSGEEQVLGGADRESRYMFPFFRGQPQLVKEFLEAHQTPMESEAAALRAISDLAEEQQLGMASLRHAFTPDLKKETYMIGLSLFSLPASLLPFLEDPQAHPTWCQNFDVRQSFCVFLTRDDGSYYAGDGIAKEVTAAVSSAIAYDMRIDGFRAADVARWHEVRQTKGCLYGVQSLRTLLDSIRGNPDMRIPFAVHRVFARLEQLARDGKMVQVARAADDLQYEPLLTPQLYMPLDHSILSQMLILLPVLSMALLSCRFWIGEKPLDRKRKRLLAEREKLLQSMEKKE